VSREIKDELEIGKKEERRNMTADRAPMVHRQAHEGRRHRWMTDG
jgi:hypothetical protein